MTAQHKLRDLLREHVAPVLRDHGFAGSGQDFGERIDHDWAVINVQRDRHSNADEVRFTVNLGVACPDVLGEEAIATAVAPPEVLCQYRIRLGALLPSRHDTWWTVRSNMTAVEAEVLGSTLSGYLVDVAIPALVRMADHQAILRTYAPDGSFEDLAPHDMDVIGPILRRMGPAPRFASYLATLDASSPVTSLYDIGFESRQRLGPAGTAKAIARLESTRSEPTVSAVMGLSNATADGAVLAAVRPLLDDPNPHLRKAAVGTLARLGDIGSLDRMVSMIDGDPSRTAACQAALAASMLSPRLSAEQRSRSAAAIIRRHARAVGHERPILRSLAAAFEGPA